MIKLICTGDSTEIAVAGKKLDLLAEFPIGVGRILYQLTHDTPYGLRDELIKLFFELVLEQIKREEADSNAN